ncbi:MULTISPECIES: GNAT family N-acetyltransferase [unclassified Streptomyces]|uniref:GNAT family N-acetyltransferase n=1 Tax=unclassified Streptomyces TaxID=2593676 RepID=UPI002E334EF4|nr:MULTISPECIES: GNAT family N-acetyltransferase [unclassified Streptomyces]WUC64165.1 GNAT family N-acetyltransferase [Streptomyces sp. NBC_00539]
MTWTLTTDFAAFVAAARPAVAARPVENTSLLTAMDALERRGPTAYGPDTPFFGWWTGADGAVSGGLLRTPPRPLLLGAVPADAVEALGAALSVEPLLAGVDGFNVRRRDAAVLAASWGKPSRIEAEDRLYRLAGLIAPHPVPEGRPLVATEAHLPLLVEWVNAFKRESGEPGSASETTLRDRLSYGGMLLWEHAGTPVSMAGFFRPVGSVSRVGPVYTPPELRGRGYAAGVTHAVSEAAYGAGATEVLLYADLANPTSNGVYQRLGYTPVEDRVELAAV